MQAPLAIASRMLARPQQGGYAPHAPASATGGTIVLAKFRSSLTYGNVMATIAVFVALGGTSYAVATGSIDSREIKNNTVRSKDIRNNQVRGKDVRKDTLTGVDVRESKLGTVPRAGTATTADLLDGFDSTAFLRRGRVVTPSMIGTIPAARAYATQDQTIPFSTTTPVALDAEAFDNANLHNTATNNSRLTAPIAGIYQIEGAVQWDSNTTGNSRNLSIQQFGSDPRPLVTDARPANVTSQRTNVASTLTRLAAGDYIELRVIQDGGAGVKVLNCTGAGNRCPVLSMHWVGP
jgi:hypothetical protein